MEGRVLEGGRPSLYRTLSVLSNVSESVDRGAGLVYNRLMCDGVLRGGRLTDHRMNELRV